LRVVKSRQRTVVTLALGAFKARELLKSCERCASEPALGSARLGELVKSRQRFGYDLIVHVGLARYLRAMQRDEIRDELRREHGIELSSGTVSALCDRFLVCLESLHLLRSPYLRAAMVGGYPLHLDATCDRGKGGLFVCLDGWRGWVLIAARIPSENPDHMRPVVAKTVALFGDPVATVRDMGEGGAHAVESLRKRGVPDLICHYHFLAAVGEKLFDQPYSLVRHTLRASRVRTDLRTLLRDLQVYGKAPSQDGRFGPGQVRSELLAVVHWVLEADGNRDAAYPFSLPHYDFVLRCRQAPQRVERWAPCPRTQPERRALRHMASVFARLERDERICTAISKIERSWQSFSELREVLRLTNAQLPRGDERYDQHAAPAVEHERLQQIEQAVREYRQRLSTRVLAGTKSNPGSPEAVISKYLERYGHLLFGHPVRRDERGAVIAVVARTNNVIEHFFGHEKQRLRRRLGRANLGRDLEQQPAQAALAANLRHADYVRLLCGSLDNLPAAFAELDARAIRDSTPLVRDHRDSQLQGRVRALLQSERASVNDLPGPETRPADSPATVV
jgi:hypothetical protein